MLFVSDDKIAVSGTKVEIMAQLSFLIHKLLTHSDGGKDPILTKEDVDSVVEVATVTAEEREEMVKKLEEELRALDKTMFLTELIEGIINAKREREN